MKSFKQLREYVRYTYPGDTVKPMASLGYFNFSQIENMQQLCLQCQLPIRVQVMVQSNLFTADTKRIPRKPVRNKVR